MKHLHLELETPYQVTPLPLSNGQAVHRITISADEGSARVTLDPNICQLDHFGDTTACTRIATRFFDAKLSLLEVRDGKRLFAIEPQDTEQPSLQLVLHPERHCPAASARLLVLDMAGAIKAVVALEQLPHT
ncbi:hypothetical protein BO221_13165 [Archangium sp. Cb G35]|uniref:hypothetical protein n=1 Tax=Archangium sp. Cb G35 TaxID=1920190 RepID=UPI000936247A|nr:hypothetical protein [Archangium sp. Cb G35]OJT24135.1 hypothetical protein BO221_13165 [Archangium sp. Cb G35]